MKDNFGFSYDQIGTRKVPQGHGHQASQYDNIGKVQAGLRYPTPSGLATLPGSSPYKGMRAPHRSSPQKKRDKYLQHDENDTGTSPRAKKGNKMRDTQDMMDQYNIAYVGNGGSGGTGAAVSSLQLKRSVGSAGAQQQGKYSATKKGGRRAGDASLDQARGAIAPMRKTQNSYKQSPGMLESSQFPKGTARPVLRSNS